MKRRIIPFGWLPAAWGLRGKSRKIAELEYYHEGEDLEWNLIQLEDDGTDKDLKVAEHLLKYKKISRKEYEWKLIQLKDDTEDKVLEELEHKLGYNEITQDEYNHKRADLLGKPWVRIINTEYDPSDPLTGSLELDWNEHFIKSLDEAGYVAPSEEEMVDLWLSELCKNIATEQFGGVGEFDDKAEETLEQKKKRTLDNGRYEQS